MNKVMLIGNVGQEPEVRYVDRDVPVARFSLATNERGYVLQNGVKVPDRTDWHNIVLWRGLAKVVENYVHKGDKLYVEGRLRYVTFDDKRGQRREQVEIWAENIELLSPKAAAPQKADNGAQAGATQQNAAPVMDDGGGDVPF